MAGGGACRSPSVPDFADGREEVEHDRISDGCNDGDTLRQVVAQGVSH